ncbi:DUF4328 domain-containing protein [Streptomyces sp. NPDC057806]|uniref:DUF4328 domain-containing protein n=1 Tax=Streptomyces sp. NPDC057806 TaxID=3346255 RepID=UPI003682D418
MTLFDSPRPHAPLPQRISRPSPWMLITLLVALAGAALSAAFAVVAGVALYGVIDGDSGFLTAPQAELHSALSLYEKAGRFQGLTYLACAVVFLCWFLGMRRATGPLAPDRFRHGTGWAIGSWFIPIAHFWLPYRIAFDMWGAASPLPTGGQAYRAPLWPVNIWWGLFVSNVLFSRYAAMRFDTADNLTELRDAVRLYLICDSLEILAAGAAAFFAVRLTAMRDRKITQGPYLAAV